MVKTKSNAIKIFLGIDETPPTLERYLKAATKLSCELPTVIEMESIPLMELSSLADDRIFMLKHKKLCKILILMCYDFYGSIRPYKPYKVSL